MPDENCGARGTRRHEEREDARHGATDSRLVSTLYGAADAAIASRRSNRTLL